MKTQVRFMFLLATVVCANAQVVPVGAVGQAIVARFYPGVDCTTGAPNGFGTVALYTPVMVGIPQEFLFQPGATVHDLTTATITGVFEKLTITQTTNFNVTNTFVSGTTVNFYYHPNSSPKDWTDFDGFQTGQLIGKWVIGIDMFGTVNGVSWGQVTGPLTYSADFTLPDGRVINLRQLMPGGVTVSTFTELGALVTTSPGGPPQVVNLTSGKGPVVLGSCAVMVAGSGIATNPGLPKKVRLGHSQSTEKRQ
jgi:hypothetical protein